MHFKSLYNYYYYIFARYSCLVKKFRLQLKGLKTSISFIDSKNESDIKFIINITLL